MSIPMQLIEAQLITKFNLHGYENENVYRFELQVVTYHFNLRF